MLNKQKLATENPALLYKMLLKEQAKIQVEGVSKSAMDFLNAVRDSIDEYIDIYQEDYGENWQEVFESDWRSLYYEVLEKHSDKLLEYVRSIV